MFYNNLGNKAPLAPNGNIQSDYGLQNVGRFNNLAGVPDLHFWSGSLIPSEPNLGIIFTFYDGAQLPFRNSYDNMFAWAVRDGDVGLALTPVPEPSITLLLGTSLLGLAVASRKKFLEK